MASARIGNVDSRGVHTSILRPFGSFFLTRLFTCVSRLSAAATTVSSFSNGSQNCNVQARFGNHYKRGGKTTVSPRRVRRRCWRVLITGIWGAHRHCHVPFCLAPYSYTTRDEALTTFFRVRSESHIYTHMHTTIYKIPRNTKSNKQLPYIDWSPLLARVYTMWIYDKN